MEKYIGVKNRSLMIVTIMLLLSCDNKITDVPDSGKENFITVQFALKAIDITSIHSITTKGAKVEQGALDISLGENATNADKKSNYTTRSSSGIDETAINEVCIFQFNGTEATSTLIAQEYYSSPNVANLGTTLIENSSDQTVYVLANVGNITGNYTGTTTLSDFRTSTLNFATETDVTSGSDLPMIGVYTGSTIPGLYSISLTRMVAKISLICNVSLSNSGDAFEVKRARICHVPNLSQMIEPTGAYPANGVTDALKYTNYDMENYITGGNTLIWYIPENLKGTVSGITNETDKSKVNAPAYSSYIEVEGVYTPSGETAEDVTYRIYPGGNMTTNFDIARNTSYSIVMTIKGMNEIDNRVLIPENLSINNAGQQVTANCYIVNNSDQIYKFNATVMGNGAVTPSSTSGNQIAPAITPTTMSPSTAFLVWETGINKGEVIEDGSVQLVDGYVRFKTADNNINGNAVIAVSDGTNILWSWHIWKTDYTPNIDNPSTYDTYVTYASRSFKIMKYNLGAIVSGSEYSASATNIGDLGLYYQWGRKDPFVGGDGWTATRISTVNANGYEWKDGSKNSIEESTTSSIPSSSAIPTNFTAGVNATIEYARRNPTHFISFSNSTVTDWLDNSSHDGERDNLWGNPNETNTVPNTEAGSKSIYDPCPYGWRIPRQDSFTRFSTTGLNTTNSNEFNVSGSFSNGWVFYIDELGNTSFWPASGFRDGSSGGIYFMYNFYWASSAFNTTEVGASVLYFNSNVVGPLAACGRSTGLLVRCVQE